MKIGYIVVQEWDYEGHWQHPSEGPSVVYLDRAEAEAEAKKLTRPHGSYGEVWEVQLP